MLPHLPRNAKRLNRRTVHENGDYVRNGHVPIRSSAENLLEWTTERKHPHVQNTQRRPTRTVPSHVSTRCEEPSFSHLARLDLSGRLLERDPFSSMGFVATFAISRSCDLAGYHHRSLPTRAPSNPTETSTFRPR